MPCLPSKSKCEWFELRDFVRHYNESCGTAYDLDKCLDVEERTRPQPEVPIKSVGFHPMVIERKSVIWPLDFAKGHDKEHTIMSVLSQELNPYLQDGAFVVELHEAEIRKKSAAHIVPMARQIAGSILAAKRRAKAEWISGRAPLRWTFGPHYDSEAKQGVTVVVIGSRNLLDLGYYEKSVQGGATELVRQLEKAKRKFEDYTDCIKTVVVQFFGEDFVVEQVEEMLARIEIPTQIDQVWLARSEAISDEEYEMRYYRVHPIAD